MAPNSFENRPVHAQSSGAPRADDQQWTVGKKRLKILSELAENERAGTKAIVAGARDLGNPSIDGVGPDADADGLIEDLSHDE
jgi:hypothetical protein